jgi:hypothetical protein
MAWWLLRPGTFDCFMIRLGELARGAALPDAPKELLRLGDDIALTERPAGVFFGQRFGF